MKFDTGRKMPTFHPFQKLCRVRPTNCQPFLLAASGPIISSFSLKDGSLLNQWPRLEDTRDPAASSSEGDRPNKRRKIEEEEQEHLSRQASEDSIDIKTERQRGERRKPKIEGEKLPAVSHIIATSDCAVVVVITVEDKSVNVLEVQPGGILVLQSQRSTVLQA